MLLVHGLEVLDGSISIGAIVVNAEEIGRVGRNAVHEVGDPSLPLFVAGAGGTDEFFAFLLAERQHLLDPDIGGMLGGDTGALGLIEEVDDRLIGIFNVGPVLT